MKQVVALGALILGGIVVACGASAARGQFEDKVPDAAVVVDSATAPLPETGPLFNDADPTEELSPQGTWTGTVYTPAADIPISGALVYLTPKKPEPIPDGNFCDTCVQLNAKYPKALTKFDGTFSLVANRPGKQYLVIQKGQFRRVLEVDVKPGDVRVSKKDSSFVSRKDAATGDMVPSILVSTGNYDEIEKTLDKLGITSYDKESESNEKRFLSDAARLARYHILFLPCGSCVTGGGTNFSADDPAVKKGLKDFATAGGKVYVTDWKQGFVSEPFPEYVQFEQARGCTGAGYESRAIVTDDGLRDWLNGLGHTTFNLEANYQTVTRVKSILVKDSMGVEKPYTPKVWMSGRKNITGPETVNTLSFEYGCGRVLYSTYHTEPSTGSGLSPQEKALFYILFEVAACVIEPVIPK